MLPEAAAAKVEPIRLQYHYDLGDLQEAQRTVLRRWWRRLRGRLLLILSVFALFMFLLAEMDRHSPWVPGFLGSLLTIAVLVFGAWLKSRKPARNIWALNPLLKQRFDTEVDQRGIRSKCAIASSERDWQAFTGFFESETLFHIQQGPNQFLWLPKRAFAGEQEIERMRQLMRSKLIRLDS